MRRNNQARRQQKTRKKQKKKKIASSVKPPESVLLDELAELCHPVTVSLANGELFCFIEKGTGTQAKAAIFECIEVFYNRQRRHSGIGYQTPIQAFENMTWKMAA